MELEKKELETKLEKERLLQEKELLIRDKQLKSVQTQLQSVQEVNTIILYNYYEHVISIRIFHDY